MSHKTRGFSFYRFIVTLTAILCVMYIPLAILYNIIPAFRNVVNLQQEESLESYDKIEDVAARLEQEIMAGSKSFSFYSGKIPADHIKQVNTYIDPTYGTATYQETEGVRINPKTTLQIELKPAYYVYASLKEGKQIPESETKAIELEKKVKKILAKTVKDSMSDFQKELALHDYLVKNCKYSETLTHSKTSNIYNSYGALVEHKAVCDGYAQALQLLFTCAGVTSKYISGTADSSTGTMDHAWNLVHLGKDWYHVDATWNDPVPDREKQITHAYFNVTDEFIKGSHFWNKEKYPAATSKKMNYYTKKKSRFSNWKKLKKAAYKALVTKDQPLYEAYIGKRTVDMDDLQFLYEGSGINKQFSWNLIEEGTGNVLILTSS